MCYVCGVDVLWIGHGWVMDVLWMCHGCVRDALGMPDVCVMDEWRMLYVYCVSCRVNCIVIVIL